MATRPEMSHTRDLTMSQWIREKLPDSSTGTMVSDIDFCIWNYKTREMTFIEVKQFGKQLATWQKRLFSTEINPMLIIGADAMKIKYYGFHIVIFERKSFEDGKCWIDGSEVTEDELRQILSFHNNNWNRYWLNRCKEEIAV